MMTSTDGLPSIPDSFSLRETSDILDRAKRLIGPTLPGCTLRRFDYPIFDGWSPLELCFGDSGPIVPKLVISPDGYFCVAMLFFGYCSFLRNDMRVGYEFRGPQVSAWQRLDAGAEAIAAAMQTVLAKFDLASAISGGTIEHMWATPAENYNLTRRLDHSLCGIYLGEYKVVQNLLRDCQRDAAKYDEDPLIAAFARKCGTYLAKLTADPASLRQELIATMERNWAHFKIIEP